MVHALVGQEQGPRICISNRFPGDTQDVAGAWGPRRKDSRENSGAVAPSSPHCEPRLPQPVATRGHVAMRGPPPAALPATACALRQCESRPNRPVRHSRQRPRVAGTASRRAGSRHVRGGVCTRHQLRHLGGAPLTGNLAPHSLRGCFGYIFFSS